MISKIKKNKIYYICALIVFLIINFIFIINKIYPYGDSTLIKLDLYYQYYPMLNELKTRIISGKSLIYSFNDGLGMPFIRNFVNYLSSPFNIVFIILKNKILSVHLIITLKIIAISLTTLFYLRKKFESDNILLIIPAILFSFCGWINAYYFNIMWLDALIYIPLITLGIERLVDKHKILLYIFSLALLVISNYYMGFMMCVYSSIYFVFYNIYKIKKGSIKYKINELSRNLLIFMGSSFVSILLCSVILLPMFYITHTINGKLDMFQNILFYNFNILDFLAGHFFLTNNTILTSVPSNPTAPNVYTGLLSIILFIPFILNKLVDKKTKFFYIILLLLFSLFFFVPFLDYIINMFHIPADLPYRYSFMYSFILIIILSYELLNIKSIKIKDIVLSFIFVLSIIMCALLFKTTKININAVYYNIFIIVSLFIALLFINKSKLFIYLIIFICCIESVLNFNYKPLSVNKIDTINNYKINDDSDILYRQEIISDYTNLSLIHNYYGLSHSSSMNYSNTYELLYDLGVSSDFSAYTNYLNNNPLVNMLFNIKYIYNGSGYVKNDYVLSLMFGIDKKIDNELDINNLFFINQNKLVEEMTGIDELFIKEEYNGKSLIYEDDYYIIYKYIYSDNTYLKFDASNINFITNGNTLYSIYDNVIYYDANDFNRKLYFNPYMIEIKNNELIVCYFKERYNEDYLYTFKLDEDKFSKVYSHLNSEPVEITSFNEDYIEGKINVVNSKSVFSTIPYDDGWEVFIDDKKVKTYSNLDSLLGFDMDKGKHNIKLKYHVPYLWRGIIISLSTLIIITGFSVYKRVKNKNM